MSTSSQTAEFAATPETLPDWKQEITARLSAHRTRRGAFDARQPALPGMETGSEPDARAARVAARVAERYAKAPTYSEMLAAEAANAARAAAAAAHAAHEAHQAAQAVTDVLWSHLDAEAEQEQDVKQSSAIDSQAIPRIEFTPQPAHYHVDPASLPAARRSQTLHSSQSQPDPHSSVDPHPHIFDPFEDALVAPAQPLPARVLEFPRELVAARKARPRHAEGPLCNAGTETEKTQLRIFEVEPETISHQPPASDPALNETPLLPGWSSIRLDATPRRPETEMAAASETVDEFVQAAQGSQDSRNAPFSSRGARQAPSSGNARKRNPAQSGSLLADMLPLHVAPIEDRLMAAIVDTALVLCAFLLFILVFVACTPHLPTGKPAMIAAGAALVGFIALYQWLFFSYAESTPGMRYAKIALCTFDDENPARKTLQHRIAALFLAALPMGLGFLWALLDDDRLGWHDRMTRTYQRSYR